MPKIIYEQDDGKQTPFNIPTEVIDQLKKINVDPWTEVLKMVHQEILKIESKE